MCPDMMNIFLYLCLEIICVQKYLVVSDDVHDVYVNDFAINISIEIENMDFKVSFFSLI